ncbi:MAG TPA: TIGR03936 family radical SAM-associated protein [Phycisphaerae bacterium]|nr:TIGR03936 family radical SAM-associated protein [Phycisphaerae bacterium]HNU46217.1 TIGR03936 family radical SAM-associated protein [Phycisphaerae bacterium]
MGDGAARDGGRSGPRYRLLFRYRVDGDLRFVSHHDTVRLFERALARAALPVGFSAGFNPRPRVSVPVPRPVGVASDDEALLIELTQGVEPAEALHRLRAQLPAGMELLAVEVLKPQDVLQPESVRYRLDLPDQPPSDLPQRVRDFLASDIVEVQRENPKARGIGRINVRRYLAALSLTDGGVEFDLRWTPQGTARPVEIAQVLGFEPDSVTHRIRRLEIRWQPRTRSKNP